MIQTRYLLALVWFGVILAVTLVVIVAADLFPLGPGPPIDPTGEPPLSQVRPVVAQGAAGGPVPTRTEPAAPQLDGPSIMVDHCSHCHLVRSLERMDKQRSEWEGTLARMDRLGVHLSEAETVTLLDYLAATDRP